MKACNAENKKKSKKRNVRTHRNMKTETNKIKEQKYRKEMKNGNKYIVTYRKESKVYQYFHSYNFLKSIFTHYIYTYII